MGEKALALLASFESLSENDKQDFVNAVLLRLAAVDSGALDDELVATAGDDLAAMLQQEQEDNANQP